MREYRLEGESVLTRERQNMIITHTLLMFPPQIPYGLHWYRGSGSSVGIATGYGLDGPGIVSRGGQIFRTCPDRL
jgi:hypothetical protein